MIKSGLTLKQLEAFAYVVDLGTFRAAAVALGTTQPNISARITALERSLGTSLLVRDAGSVRLTEKGRRLLEKTREVIWAGEALLEEAERHDLIEERLRLGVTELVAFTWLQTFLRLFNAAYPNIQIELEVALSNVIDTKLREGRLDLALQSVPFTSETTGLLALGEEPHAWVAVPEIAAAFGPDPGLEALFAGPVLSHDVHTQAGHALHTQAEALGLNTRQIVHFSALSACVPMVCEGLGVALVPKAMVRVEIASGTLRVVAADWLPPPMGFFARYHADRAPRFVTQAAQFGRDAMQDFLATR